jgi:hypothetical protein
MEFDLRNCWDCPVPLWLVLAQYAVLILAGGAGAWMQRRQRPGVRALGTLLVVGTLLWAALATLTTPRWGIWRSDDPLEVFGLRTTYAIFAALDLVLVVAIVAVKRRAFFSRRSA